MLVDILEGKQNYVPCLDDIGFVRLVDSMPRLVEEGQTCDHAIVQAARTSYGEGTKTVTEDRGLIRYLYRHMHTTPLEMAVFKWHMKMPIFVARQFIRHRMSSVNEISARYSVMKDEFFLPSADDLRKQSTKNKQGSEGKMDATDAFGFSDELIKKSQDAYAEYITALNNGVTREQARMILPLNLYTEWYWKADLHNTLHMLGLRTDKHAQLEIQTYANAVLTLMTPLVPWTVEAFNEYHPNRNGMKLSGVEVEALKDYVLGIRAGDLHDNKREQADWVAKLTRLGV